MPAVTAFNVVHMLGPKNAMPDWFCSQVFPILRPESMIYRQAQIINKGESMVRSLPMSSRVLALVVLGLGSNAVAAAGQVSAGVHGNWGGDTDIGVGARTIVGLGGVVRGFETFGSFDYFFPSDDIGADITYWEVNANLVYRVNVVSQSTALPASWDRMCREMKRSAGSICWEESSSSWEG
jgi:hypothetical protein